MAEKFIPCTGPDCNLALLAELIRTVRAGQGLEPGVYDVSKGGLTIPDDLDAKKVKEDTKAEKKKAEAEEKKARAEADAIAKEAKEATAEKEPKAK